MWAEMLAAVVVALVMLWLIFQPLLSPATTAAEWIEPEDPDETPRGIALLALKELDLDRETGKLSDEDYRMLQSRYAAEALQALRNEEEETADSQIEALIAGQRARPSPADLPSGHLVCPTCGPRPEADACFCSGCGVVLVQDKACAFCGTAVVPGQKFCGGCGNAIKTSGAPLPV